MTNIHMLLLLLFLFSVCVCVCGCDGGMKYMSVDNIELSNAENLENKKVIIANILNFAKFTFFFGIVSILQYFLNMLVGVWIIGRINAEYMHAIGSAILSLGSLYGLLNFLRVATAGFSSQAKYTNDNERVWSSFLESAILSIIVGFVFIVLKKFLISGSIFSYKLSGEIAVVASEYLNIIILSAPINLLNFTITGWLMGRGSIIKVLVMQLVCTAINVCLAMVFTWNMGLAAKGVGLAFVLSQVVMCILGLVFIFHILFKNGISFNISAFTDERKKMLIVDSHLVLRFIFLIIQAQIFNTLVARLGDSYISASNMLMNFVFISSGMFEGIANASSIFAGRAMAEKSSDLLKFTWKMTNLFTIAMSVVLCLIYVIIRVPFIEQIANNPTTQKITTDYSLWLVPYFLIGGFSMSYFGIFLGAIFTKPLATSAFMSLVTFAFVYYAIGDIVVQNGHSIFIAIWIAYILFYLIRSLGLFLYKDKLLTILDK